ncbi:RNA polymerase sigma factor [Catalinimonas niigatensis]|uniref:RNA polymerase sigma factor n=1 Tax=Catalinimonas niigatensis TaxID=1397264 RepID=UPI002666EF7C|nr:sigma-70 family RNA polymerase sigma factor [Catalinimonas niigatensis]WPP50443.1 sigma-70 family RNA polymerase sigma factor [Catalinimonas niigatensis]
MKSGSEKAFEQLYDKFFPLLFRYGLQFCPARDTLKDCLQDFFVDLFVRRSSLNEVKHVKNYLYTAFRHRLIRHLSGRQLLLEPLSLSYHFEVTFSHEHALIHEQLDELKQRKLVNAFKNLSSRQKEAVFLRFYENMGYEEIAGIMKMKKVKYARTLVYRAIGVLRECIKDLDGSLTLYSMLPLLLLCRFPHSSR